MFEFLWEWAVIIIKSYLIFLALALLFALFVGIIVSIFEEKTESNSQQQSKEPPPQYYLVNGNGETLKQRLGIDISDMR